MKRFVFSCNCYLYNGILIDPGKGVSVRLPVSSCVITHEHCDHFAGLDDIDCKEVAASRFCAEVINEKKDEYGVCSYFGVDYPKRKVERMLADGDIVQGDGCALKVLETPGHAKGAICLYDEDKKLLFSGDTVFPGHSMPRTDLPSSEPEKLKETYSRLETLDIETIFPGHGDKIEEKEYMKRILGSLG